MAATRNAKKHPHRQSKENSQTERIHLLGKIADADPGDEAFTCSFAPDGFAGAFFYYTFLVNPLTPREEKQRDPHQQVRRHQQHQRLVPVDYPV